MAKWNRQKQMEGWGKVKSIGRYAGVSERTVEEWLKRGLKHSQLPSGLRLIKYEWVDKYLESFPASSEKVDRIVREALEKV